MTDFPAIRRILQEVGHKDRKLGLEDELSAAWAEYEQARKWQTTAAEYAGEAHELQAKYEMAQRDIVELEAHICDTEDALRDLYDVGVQVADVTNPDLKRHRKRLGLFLDKYEALVKCGMRPA